MPSKRPVYVRNPLEPETVETVCSWCGMAVSTVLQQECHTRWHRAVGVVPLHADFEDDSL